MSDPIDHHDHPKFTEADTAWRSRHRPGDYHDFTGGPFCKECRKIWPCVPAFEHEAYCVQRAGETEAEWTARRKAIMPSVYSLFSPAHWSTWDEPTRKRMLGDS